MNLMIAVLHLTAVVNIRQTHRATARERDCARVAVRPRRAGIGAAASIRITIAIVAVVIGAVLEVNPVTGRDAVAEVEQERIRTPAIQLGQLGGIQHPDADAIAVCRRLGPARMIPARLAAVFDVHPEQAGARFAITVGARPVAYAGEDNLVGRRTARLRSRNAVTRIAHAVHNSPWRVLTIAVQVRLQAGAIQRVIVASVEVAFQAALGMAHMSPAAMDAGVAQLIGSSHQAVGVTDRRADLAAVSDVTHVIRTHIRPTGAVGVVLPATAGYTARQGNCRRPAEGT